ncbi:MAG: hypothetical protein AAGI38_07385, partial [Bacteroidota bacterium]
MSDFSPFDCKCSAYTPVFFRGASPSVRSYPRGYRFEEGGESIRLAPPGIRNSDEDDWLTIALGPKGLSPDQARKLYVGTVEENGTYGVVHTDVANVLQAALVYDWLTQDEDSTPGAVLLNQWVAGIRAGHEACTEAFLFDALDNIREEEGRVLRNRPVER